MILDFRFAIFDLSKKLMFSLCLCAFVVNFSYAQEPKPAPPRPISVPKVLEERLPNGMRIVVVPRKNVPLVSVNLMVSAGASYIDEEKAGLTNMTASLLTKGTKTRNAEQIAQQMEFLGSSLYSSSNWENTNIGFNCTIDKLPQAMAILADVVKNPTFSQKELDLLKSQMKDDLTNRLKQPGTLARYVMAVYSFGETSIQGTPETIESITRKDILDVYKEAYKPENMTFVFTGDITKAQAKSAIIKSFGNRVLMPQTYKIGSAAGGDSTKYPTLEEYRQIKAKESLVKRFLVVDLPNSGQASVNYVKKIESDKYAKKLDLDVRRDNNKYFDGSVANSLLGGGYSSRLNQEIRIKRGLSYGAGSSVDWRWDGGNFSTRCQTKTVSAAEVAEVTLKEIERLINEKATDAEITPRKNVLIGEFGRGFETNDGVNSEIQEYLTFGLEFEDMSTFKANIEKVSAQDVQDFALFNLKGGDLIIVGDYNDFKDDFAKRFPNAKVEVIKASELNLNSDTLR
jgi:zinc protease